MRFSTIIVYEQSGVWASDLRRALELHPARIRETRRLADCEAELALAPDSLALVEWSAERRAELALFVDQVARRFPRCRLIALGEANGTADADSADETLAREAGAVHFVRGRRALAAVARLVRRQSAVGETRIEADHGAAGQTTGQLALADLAAALIERIEADH